MNALAIDRVLAPQLAMPLAHPLQALRSTPRRARRIAALLLLFAAAGSAHAQSSSTPAGLWKTIDDSTHQERSLVRITETGGVFSGRIEKLLDPSLKPDTVCDQCSGEHKDQPLVGLTVISGIAEHEADSAVWAGGEILDPRNGETYKLRLTLSDGGKRLEVRGYLGMPALGRTQSWIRVE